MQPKGLARESLRATRWRLGCLPTGHRQSRTSYLSPPRTLAMYHSTHSFPDTPKSSTAATARDPGGSWRRPPVVLPAADTQYLPGLQEGYPWRTLSYCRSTPLSLVSAYSTRQRFLLAKYPMSRGWKHEDSRNGHESCRETCYCRGSHADRASASVG